ncbi:MAG: LacI family DNA-binding transcriptional regulator [Clostridia bacterium]|nr:LacI family DNA-binding transcriptional regulator [Clostridia bacterium]
MKQNVNIKDIARLSGVGISTVSRVLNDHTDVKKETREKVLQVIKEYNYIPNNSARNLKRSVSKNIGVLVKGIYNPFFSKVVRAIEEEIARHDYSMILHYNSKDATNDSEVAIELIKEKKLTGLICLGGDFEDIDTKQIAALETPMVLCSTMVRYSGDENVFSSVNIDDAIAAELAVKEIICCGHRRIGMIRLREDDFSVCQYRMTGYKRALDSCDIPYDPELVEAGDYTFETGYKAMQRLLDKQLDMTAVFVSTDLMAVGAARAAMERGIKVPEELSIVGFDGIEFAEYFMPSISTVMQPVEEMGIMSVEILFDVLNNDGVHRQILFDTKFLHRESLRRVGGEACPK